MNDRVPEFVVGATNVYRTRISSSGRKSVSATTERKTTSCSATTHFSGVQPSGTGSTRYFSAAAGT